MKVASVLVLTVLLATSASGAERDPAVEGIALCRQPLPGQTVTFSQCENLVLVSVPDGKPVPLFSKTPPDRRPKEGFFQAALLDGGRRVILHLSYWRSNRDGSVLLVDPATGKLTTIADDVGREPFVVFPRRNAVLYRDRKTNQLKVWHTDGRQVLLRLPKGWSYDGADWSPNWPHVYLTLEDSRGNARGFWFDERTGSVTPVPANDPWPRALDVHDGRYLVVDDSSNLWLKGAGKKPAKLAHLDANGGPPEDVWARFSPDGRYVVCTAGRSQGEPAITYTGQMYYFDLRGAKPVQLQQPKDHGNWYDTWIASDGFLGWGKTEPGILHKAICDLMWTPLPSLQTHSIYKLPDQCEFEDFVRRDAVTPR